MRKNKVFNFIILLTLLLLTGCSSIFERPSYEIYIYTSRIYGIIKDGKIDRMGISRNDIRKMKYLFSEKYGIEFYYDYNKFFISNKPNKDYDSKTQSSKKQYIHFFDDIKITIGNKEFVIPKEDITESTEHSGLYTYPAPIKVKYSRYNDVIIDLGEVKIYDENGKIQRKRRKIPPILIKKVYKTIRYNNFMRTSKDILYEGWAEDYPEELKNMREFKEIEKLQKANSN